MGFRFSAELMFLLFGLQLGYAARNASVQFNERTFLSGAVFVEILFSSVFYVIRILYWSAMSPTNVLVVAFIRSQLTNSLVLLLIFSPKVRTFLPPQYISNPCFN